MGIEEKTPNEQECNSHNLILDTDSLVFVREKDEDILGSSGQTIGTRTISTYECKNCRRRFDYKSEGS